MNDDYINPTQYSAYKERLKKIEEAEEKEFRRDWCLHKDDKDHFNFVNYLEELSILERMDYKEYVKDFYERYGDVIDEYYSEDYDEDW